jgi:tetraacyldisaccharide 4'-kinase
MIDVNRHWYQSSYTWLSFLLLPVSWLFRLIVNFRRNLYRLGIKKNYQFNTPVIVVGNITIGGTGKTPFVIWLAHFLKAQGYRPGIVSRGYGARKKLVSPRYVDSTTQATEAGDEAVLLADRSACPVVTAASRVEAVKALLAASDCNIVISDDGLQHYRLGRQLEIAIVDGERRFGNNCFLPAGPLREAVSRLQTVDFVVAQQGALQNEYEMRLSGDSLVAIQNPTLTVKAGTFQGKRVHAVAAIGNPQRFFSSLKNFGMEVVEHVFPDHYLYQANDFDFGDDLPIIMTEKDAVKCQAFADKTFWYLPVAAELTPEFAKILLQKIHSIMEKSCVN